jgi:hypothetical protein
MALSYPLPIFTEKGNETAVKLRASGQQRQPCLTHI